MFKHRRIALGITSVILSLVLAACQLNVALTPTQPAAPIPQALTPTPLPTAAPAPASQIDYGTWRLILQSRPDSSTYAAGFLDESYGLTAGYDGDVRYTTDGGQSWTRARNVSLCRFGLDIVDERVAWHCGNGGAVRVSIDSGQTWGPGGGYGSNQPNHCRFLSFLDDKTGWAATPQQLGQTTDGGQTWTDLALPEGIRPIAAIALRAPGQGYVLDTRGSLFATQDGGQTWATYSIGLKDNETLSSNSTPVAAMRFLDGRQGIVVYQLYGKIWSARTSDGGQTWQREQIPGIESMYAFYLTHDGRLLTLFDGSRVLVLDRQG